MTRHNGRDQMRYDILSLFGKEELENIQSRLAKVTQLGFVTVNYRGEPLTDFTGFCSFCEHFRYDPELHQNCEASDVISSVQSSVIKKPNIYQCPCGLMEIAIPIIVNGIYLGGVLCGQALCSNPPKDLIQVLPSIDTPHFRNTLKKADPEKQALPEYTYEKFEDIAALVSMMIEMLCENKIKQIQESQHLQIQVAGLKEIQASRQQLSRVLDQLDYLSLIEQVKKMAATFYQHHVIFQEEELYETVLAEFDADCLKVFPIRKEIFEDQRKLEVWLMQCYDAIYQKRIVQHYPILEPIFPYINQHLKENISLADIVSHCDISQGYLSRLFKQNFGITVMDYIGLDESNPYEYWRYLF